MLDDKEYFEERAANFMESMGMDLRNDWEILEQLTELLQETFKNGYYESEDRYNP